MDDVEDFLEHYGVRGMRWGARKAKSGATTAGRSVGRGAKKAASYAKQHRRGTAEVAAAVGIAATTAVIARRGMMSVSSANRMADRRSGQLLRDVGSRFVNDRTDREITMNFGRQVREGLISTEAFRPGR